MDRPIRPSCDSTFCCTATVEAVGLHKEGEVDSQSAEERSAFGRGRQMTGVRCGRDVAERCASGPERPAPRLSSCTTTLRHGEQKPLLRLSRAFDTWPLVRLRLTKGAPMDIGSATVVPSTPAKNLAANRLGCNTFSDVCAQDCHPFVRSADDPCTCTLGA